MGLTMASRPMSGQMSGCMSGFGGYPTRIDLALSITWTQNVGNVGFLQQERAPEKTKSRQGARGGLE